MPSPLVIQPPPARPAYFDGMVLTQKDLSDQQAYLNGQRQIWAAGLRTTGVIAGLDVAAQGRTVVIAPGQAITPTGLEVLVSTQKILPTPSDGAGLMDLFVGVDLEGAEPTDISLTEGDTRTDTVLQFSFLPRGSSVPTDMVFLTAAEIAEDGSVTSLDPTSRVYSGAGAGAVNFFSPLQSAPVAAFTSQSGVGPNGLQNQLNIEALEVRFSGIVDVAGGWRARPPGVHSLRVAQLDFLAPILTEIAPPGAVSRATIAHFEGETDNGTPLGVLDIDDEGQVWIGDQPQTSRNPGLTLTGDLYIEADRQLNFSGTGKVTWRDATAPGDCVMSFGNGVVDLVSTAGVEFRTGENANIPATPNPNPASLSLQQVHRTHGPSGPFDTDCVGIGVSSPMCRLSVNGAVQSLSGGFELSNGYVQTTAANSTSIMVGTIIDWWRADDSMEVPDGYMICNGQTVHNVPPHNPLYGAQLPDLNGIYMVGAGQASDIGRLISTVSHVHELQAVTPHTHPIDHIHTFSGNTEETSSSGNSYDKDDHCADINHTHSFSFQSQQPSPSDSNTNQSAPRVWTQTADARPENVRLLKLIRVR